MPTPEVGMKASRDFDQCADASADPGSTSRRFENARQQLERCRFARPVAADDAERFSRPHLEGDVPECPELFGREGVLTRRARQSRHEGGNQIAQAVMRLATSELLPHVVEQDGGVGH